MSATAAPYRPLVRVPAPRLAPPPKLDGPGTVALIRAPYDRLEPIAVLPSPEAGHRPGTVIGILINRPAEDFARLETMIQTVQAASPLTPVVLMLGVGLEDGLLLSSRAARLGVRSIASERETVRSALRRTLTERAGLAGEVVDWLGRYGVRLSPLVATLVSQIVGLAPRCENLGTLLAAVGVPETSARFRMSKKRLPPPSRWFQAARALHAALAIQAEPEVSLLRIAHRLGYADHSALSQLVHRSFRVRPGAIRGTLGWEWLMARWVQANVRGFH